MSAGTGHRGTVDPSNSPMLLVCPALHTICRTSQASASSTPTAFGAKLQ